MDSKSLMIGDWVFNEVLGSNDQVSSLSDGIGTVHCQDMTTCCSPLMLTAEILAKNGFGCTVTLEDGIDCIATRGDLTIMLWAGDWMKVSYGDTFQWYSGTRFVHELQHALRLCGLNDLADSFKV